MLARKAGYRPQSLALLCSVSLRQLERYLKAVYRQTPVAWLRSLRLEDARLLLANGQTVKATAYALGYRQISHFSREFKRQVGVCPTDFVPGNFGSPPAGWPPVAVAGQGARAVDAGACNTQSRPVPGRESVTMD